MPDIRSFFGPKGGAGLAKPKPVPKEDEPAKRKGGKARKVLDDSDDDVVEVTSKKQSSKATPKKKADAEPLQGVATTASAYFSSANTDQPKPQNTPKGVKNLAKPKVEVRVSPRTKAGAKGQEGSGPAKNGQTVTKKRATTAHKKYDLDDNDAYVDDEDDGDDIFAAEAKGRKRKNDDYEEDSEEEDQPKPKRIASRSKPVAPTKTEDSDDSFETMPQAAKTPKPGPAGKKRKATDSSSEEEEDVKPRKKPAATKPRAPRVTKADEAEDSGIQAILNDIPTVRAPTPPPKDPNQKFDWRKTVPGGGNAAAPAPNAGAVEIPVGEPDCLAGQTFVFTGVLQTIGREEAQALVKQYGGKVMGAPSRNTKWVVLGTDAGPSKLAKIRDLGIKTIDEHGLFKLIQALPASGGDGKAAEKTRQKQKDEEQKVKQAAVEMDREEKARIAAAAKAREAAAAQGAVAPRPPPPPPAAQLWTTKYAPTQLSQICGNKAQVERICKWLADWPKSRKYDFSKRGADGMGGTRAILISGPPGIGKTTAAHLAAKLAGYDVIETNASDARSKRLVEEGIGDTMNNTSLLGFFGGDGKKVDAARKNIVLIMDEVDGMSAGDRGGVVALAKFCKKTSVPLILICNERRLPKMKPLDHVAFDIKFIRPTVDMIRSRIMTICHREGLRLSPQVVAQLIEGSNKDIRQIINMISTAKLDQVSMDFDRGKSMTKAWEKHVVLKPWDICQKLLGGQLFGPASKATLNDKIELYFNDHDFSFLMIQENYLSTKPARVTGRSQREQNLKYLELVDQAAESISDGDLVDRMIHGSQQQWSLMPTHAVFSTVRPASYVSGLVTGGGGTTFTTWLGNNSKLNKLMRFIREIHSHMRLRSSGDHNEIRQQYLPVLWYQVIKRLDVDGKGSIKDVIDLMDSYYLTRDDFDAMKELGVGPQAETNINIETQTKAAFTREYNAMSHPVPFMKASNVTTTKKVAKAQPDLEEAIEEEDDAGADAVEVEADEDELDLKKDKYIKQPKAKAKRAPKKASKGDEDGSEDAAPKATKGRGKAAAKGKGKK